MLALEDPSLFVPFMREVVKTDAFTAHNDWVDACLDDAAETSVQPFVELLSLTPGDDVALWERQLLALKTIDRLDPDAIEPLQPKLQNHPSAEIRSWFQQADDEAAQKILVSEPGGYELVLIPGGSFLMGSPENEKGHLKREGPQHRVTVPAFYMGRYPVTNRQYAEFLKSHPDVGEPKYWAERKYNRPDQPVVGVSWHDAQAYAHWAELRLPSEAQWEYACRAGTTTRFYTGDKEGDLARAGWYDANSKGQPHPVGQKAPNGFGLYDMHGNVWEWVEDDWHDDYTNAPDDGSAWVGKPRGTDRVIRGGGWIEDAHGCRSAIRYGWRPGSARLRSGLSPLQVRYPWPLSPGSLGKGLLGWGGYVFGGSLQPRVR